MNLTLERINYISEVLGWPLDILVNQRKHPILVDNTKDFKRLCFQTDYREEAIILENGVFLLGLDNIFPKDLENKLNNSPTIWKFLKKFSKNMLETYQGKICYTMNNGCDNEPDLKHLKAQIQYIEENKLNNNSIYLTEVRLKKSYRHFITAEKTKTACLKDGKDVLLPETDNGCLYWDRFDSGIFIGDEGSGMGLHNDQVFWSNFGKNWSGYKLLVVWKTSDSINLLQRYRHCIFAKYPLGILRKEHLYLIRKAHRICIVKPGDVFIFSAAGAHQAISICPNKELSVSAYESYITYVPEHVLQFLQTGNETYHHMGFMMDKKGVFDIKDDILEQIERIFSLRKTLSLTMQILFERTLNTLVTNCLFFKKHLSRKMTTRQLEIIDVNATIDRKFF